MVRLPHSDGRFAEELIVLIIYKNLLLLNVRALAVGYQPSLDVKRFATGVYGKRIVVENVSKSRSVSVRKMLKTKQVWTWAGRQ
ncbi:MAG: hypothetical protein R3C05_21700 [Pirellulaceae bacterium]